MMPRAHGLPRIPESQSGVSVTSAAIGAGSNVRDVGGESVL
jgi:hypothetical protein